MADSPLPLNGRTAWITGGSSGIGAATATELRALGATVAVLDLNPPEGDLPWFRCDLSDPASILTAHDDLTQRVGPADILIASAAMPSQGHSIADLPIERWQQTLAVNVTSVFALLQLTMPGMIDRGWGRIVTVASSTALRVYPGSAGYAASKAGLIALTKVAATEGAPHGVTANVVAPGLTDTPMARKPGVVTEDLTELVTNSAIANPMGALLKPEEPADAIAWFCLPSSHRVTGQTLHVNAGSYMP